MKNIKKPLSYFLIYCISLYDDDDDDDDNYIILLIVSILFFCSTCDGKYQAERNGTYNVTII